MKRRRGRRHEAKYVDIQKESGRFIIQVWGGFTYGHHSNLVFIRHRHESERTRKTERLGMNASQYQNEVLHSYFEELIAQLPNDGVDSEVIQDYNPAHKAYDTQNWFFNRRLTLSDWPSYSPDLNLIENVWSMLKRAVKKRYRQQGHLPQTEEEMIRIAQEEWKSWTGRVSMSGWLQCHAG